MPRDRREPTSSPIIPPRARYSTLPKVIDFRAAYISNVVGMPRIWNEANMRSTWRSTRYEMTT